MSARAWPAVVLLAAGLASGCTTMRWGWAVAQGGIAFQRGDFAAAAEHQRDGLAVAEAFGEDDERLRTSLAMLAVALGKAGRIEEGTPVLERLLEVAERQLPADDPKLAEVLSVVSTVRALTGEIEAAIPMQTRAIAIFDLHPADPNRVLAIATLARLELLANRLEDAEQTGLRAVEAHDALPEPNPNMLVTAWTVVADVRTHRARFDDAEAAARRAVALADEHLTRGGDARRNALTVLGGILVHRGEPLAARPVYEELHAAALETLGEGHTQVAIARMLLANAINDLGAHDEAIALTQSAIPILEANLGTDGLVSATAHTRLGDYLEDAGRFEEAEAEVEQALAIRERRLGPDHALVAEVLADLGGLRRRLGRLDEAERLYQRALGIRQRIYGDEHPGVASLLGNLGGIAADRGDPLAAATAFRRELEIMERIYGPDSGSVVDELTNYATVEIELGRIDTAIAILERAVANAERSRGAGTAIAASPLHTLATAHGVAGRHGEAAATLERVVALLEAAEGTEHPDLAAPLGDLALAHLELGDPERALGELERALAIARRSYGDESRRLVPILTKRARAEHELGRFDDAVATNLEGIAIVEASVGPSHPDLLIPLNDAAVSLVTEGDLETALPLVRRASALHRVHTLAASAAEIGGLAERLRRRRNLFLMHVGVLQLLAAEGRVPIDEAVEESFEIAQLASAARATTGVSQMALRFAARDDRLSGLVRERQDTETRWRALQERLAEERASKAPQAGIEELLGRARLLEQRRDVIDDELERSFPEYRDLASPEPTALAVVQALLGRDEALVLVFTGPFESYGWAVRKTHAEIVRVDLTAEDLEARVGALRRALDPTALATTGRLPLFPAGAAHELHAAFFEPIDTALRGASHVFFVPDGPLSSLPPSVLVTESHHRSTRDAATLRSLPWLGERHAFTVLPSPSALRSLRRFARSSAAPLPFAGFGAPTLDGTRGNAATGPTFRSGGLADVGSVRGLEPLPETAAELRAVAGSLGAGEESVAVGAAATERAVRSSDLARHRVLSFATHGLLAGEVGGLTEPALVLTPPEVASAEDDGLLTASEIAELELDADWVVLSACNTAAGDDGASGSSGLARAFLYAGSRALLVSHWPVSSEATVALVVGTFEALADSPSIGRAEALRRAMRAVREDRRHPAFAHPAFWAPFVVVGEGGPSNAPGRADGPSA